MCNYPGDGFKHMTTDEWKRKKMSDVPQSTTHAATDTHGAHRTRSTWGGNWKTVSVYLTDAKRIDPPTKQAPLTPAEPTAAETLATMAQDLKAQNPVPTPHTPRQHDERIPPRDELHEKKKTAAQGVVIVAVSATLPHSARVGRPYGRAADIRPGQQVLEPSAGTGRIIDAIRRNANGYAITAVELNCNMAHRIRTVDCVDDTRQAKFLGVQQRSRNLRPHRYESSVCERRRYQAHYARLEDVEASRPTRRHLCQRPEAERQAMAPR
jgi:hypothetical protein